MITTQVFHIEVESGADYSVTFLYLDPVLALPIDLTGYTAQMQVRQKYDGYANTCTILEYASGVMFAPGAITLGGEEGTVTLAIPAADTRCNTWTDAVYDLFLISPQGLRTKFVKGFFTILQSVTVIS